MTSEDRYMVFKLSDVVEHFTKTEALHLARLYEIQRVGREAAGKAELRCLVVENDWPEYEPTWRAIEARATGAEQPTSHAFNDSATIAGLNAAVSHLSARLDEIRKLCILNNT
jgi:hypothetical protein